MEEKRYRLIYEIEKIHWWYQGRTRLLVDLVHRSILPKKPRILDFGCGTGSNLQILNGFGRAYGVDSEKLAIRFCRKRGLKRVKLIKANSPLPFKKDFFDLVTCLDVLEHIEKDFLVLKDFRRILKPEGSLIIFVPANQNLWGELDLRSHHVRRYSKKSLEELVSRSGFEIEESRYFNFIYFVPIFLVRIAQKFSFRKANSWGVDPVVQSQAVNKIAGLIFALDVWSARFINAPFGVSLYIKARARPSRKHD